MSWTKAILRGAALMLAMGSAASAVAGTIVIRADGPSKSKYPVGKSLGANVTLARGDTLVVLDARGTRTLSGPGTIDLAARTGTAPTALTALIQNSGSRQVRTGAVRGGLVTATTSPSLWYVDTSRSGTMCLPDLARATLWRNNSSAPVSWTLTRVSDGKAVTMAFASGQNVRSWPVADLGLTEGAEYRLSGAGLASPVSLKFAAIGAVGETPDAVAAQLIGKGCNGQVNQLVDAGKAAPSS